MGSDSDNGSRLSQRTFGVTNRIWAVLIVLVLVLTFTHFISLPTSGSISLKPTYSNAGLKAKNYFNVTDVGPNPFDFCPSNGAGDDLADKYGALTLSQSRSHLGSGARVQRLLHKALAGQPVTISVIGGSSAYLFTFIRTVVKGLF